MFGHEKRKLRHEGERGTAVVVSVAAQEVPAHVGIGAGGATFAVRAGVAGWDLTIRVKFADGSTEDYERHLTAALRRGLNPPFAPTPEVGTILPVRFDAKDRSRVEIDKAALLEASGTAGDPAPAAVGDDDALVAGPLADILRQAQQDPQGLRERLQAQAGGASVLVIGPDGGSVPLGGPAPAPVDVADQLAKLADLHDRGVLTDEEFDAQKRKLLGG